MRTFFILIFFVFGQSLSFAQITANASTVNNMVQNVLKGSGVFISNIASQGNINQQFGTFNDVGLSSGFSSGIILSTGSIQSIIGPNSSDSISNSGIGLGNFPDSDIDLLTNGQANFDQVILEFDVTPKGDEINLEMVFMSDDYPEYVCSDQADIVGIIISGPGITGPYSNNGELLSLTSNGLPIGVNSVNGGMSGALSNSVCPTGGLANSNQFIANNSVNIEMDGYTSPIVLNKIVSCNDTYHLKIVLADVGGVGSESCLLIKANGLYSSGVDNNPTTMLNDSTVIEGCRAYTLNFNRPVTGDNETINIDFSGTATLGVDYNVVNSPIVFTPADSNVQLIIEPLNDGLVEGPENVILNYFLISECGDTTWSTIEFWIDDRIPLDVVFEEEHVICDGEFVNLNADVTGGFGPYYIAWDNNPANNFLILPTEDTVITLFIFDQAGCDFYGIIDIDHVPIPNVNAGPDLELCKNETVEILAYTDGPSTATITWSPITYLDDENTITPLLVNPQTSGTYTVTVTTPEGCTGSDIVNYVALDIPYADALGGGSIVYQQEEITLTGNVIGQPVWSPAEFVDCYNCNTVQAFPTDDTWFYLISLGANGCRARDSVFVEVIVPKDVFVPSAFSPNGDGNNDVLYVRGYTIENMAFRVFDKWGTQVFFSNNPEEGWDGTLNGEQAIPGIYTYVLQTNFVNNKGSENYGGEISLVR